MRKFGAIIVVLSLLAPNAYAAGNATPLATGKPAGVQKAQAFHGLAVWVLGISIFGGGILLATSSGNNNNVNQTTVTTANP